MLKWNAMEQPNPETRKTYSGTKRTNKMKFELNQNLHTSKSNWKEKKSKCI